MVTDVDDIFVGRADKDTVYCPCAMGHRGDGPSDIRRHRMSRHRLGMLLQQLNKRTHVASHRIVSPDASRFTA